MGVLAATAPGEHVLPGMDARPIGGGREGGTAGGRKLSTTPAHLRTRTRSRARTRTRTRTHTGTNKDKNTSNNKNKNANTDTSKNANTHSNTHTHTSTCIFVSAYGFPSKKSSFVLDSMANKRLIFPC